ncbi:MAG: alpha/beta fold hydrolase [Acidimicrobiales bacterium]
MERRKWVLGAIGAGAVVATTATRQRLLARWASNPDPLNGQPVAFPEGLRRTVRLPDGAEISTVTVGDGPTIVCVHGLTGSRHDWGPMAPKLLEAGYQLVAVEQRGHGQSTTGSAGYGSARLGADLGHVLEELDIHATAVMGHSMGGMASMAYAVDQPEALQRRVSTLILIATAASLVVRGSALGFSLSGLPIPEWLVPSEKRLRVPAGLVVFGKRPSLHMIDTAIRSGRMVPQDVRAGATSALAHHDLLDRIGTIDVPTIVIGGTHDRLIWPRWVRELADRIPRAEIHMLDGAGHMVIWERRDEVVDLVVRFLTYHQAGARSTV